MCPGHVRDGGWGDGHMNKAPIPTTRPRSSEAKPQGLVQRGQPGSPSSLIPLTRVAHEAHVHVAAQLEAVREQPRLAAHHHQQQRLQAERVTQGNGGGRRQRREVKGARRGSCAQPWGSARTKHTRAVSAPTSLRPRIITTFHAHPTIRPPAHSPNKHTYKHTHIHTHTHTAQSNTHTSSAAPS